MRNIWSVIFTRAIIESGTESFSLLDSVDQLEVNFPEGKSADKGKKESPVSFSIVSLWFNDGKQKIKDFDFLIEIIDPAGKEISHFSNKATFDNNKKRLRTIVNMKGMFLTLPGQYNILIKYRVGKSAFRLVSDIPLDVKFKFNKKS